MIFGNTARATFNCTLGLLMMVFGAKQAEAVPMVVDSFVNSLRNNPLCAAPLSGTQPSLADCTTEGGSNSLLPNSRLAGLAEGRIGTRTTTGDYELDIQNNASVLTNAQFAWSSGSANSFIVEYNATTQQLTYTFGSIVQTANLGHATARPISDLFLRTTATNALNPATMTLSNLSLTQNSITTSFTGAQSTVTSTSTAGYVSYLWIGGIDPSLSFRLDGTATMSFPSFTGGRGSNIAFQIKMGSVNPDAAYFTQSVPEPSTVAMIGGALIFLGCWGRKKR
jgi:hypothetical protein